MLEERNATKSGLLDDKFNRFVISWVLFALSLVVTMGLICLFLGIMWWVPDLENSSPPPIVQALKQKGYTTTTSKSLLTLGFYEGPVDFYQLSGTGSLQQARQALEETLTSQGQSLRELTYTTFDQKGPLDRPSQLKDFDIALPMPTNSGGLSCYISKQPGGYTEANIFDEGNHVIIEISSYVAHD